MRCRVSYDSICLIKKSCRCLFYVAKVQQKMHIRKHMNTFCKKNNRFHLFVSILHHCRSLFLYQITKTKLPQRLSHRGSHNSKLLLVVLLYDYIIFPTLLGREILGILGAFTFFNAFLPCGVSYWQTKSFTLPSYTPFEWV